MRERGRYQIQAMKTRSSNGVGQKIDLAYDIETMRITDTGEEQGDEKITQSGASSILNQIKPRSMLSSPTSSDSDTSKVTATVNSNRLQNMLASLKSQKE
jgi:hypothetical protein